MTTQIENEITYEFLQDNGQKTGSGMEGTVMFYEYMSIEYAILQDDSVILRTDWEDDENA